MSHLSPFRLTTPNLTSDLLSSNPKKRRKTAQNPIQTPLNMQDLLPPPLSGYGDTIVASNPFDDCPNTVNMVRNPPNMGLGPNNMGMNMHLSMCRPINNIGSPLNIGSPMMHSPNSLQSSHMMNNPMMMNGPRINGPPMGSQLGGHMNMNGPMMNSSNVSGPVGSPIHVNPMSNAMSSINGPMNSAMNSPMSNAMNPVMNSSMNGPPISVNGGMNGPSMNVNSQMNGPMSNPMGMNTPNGPMGPHGPPMNNNFMMTPMNALYPKPMPVSAGKVYPADQPMVFNSQNPNAPPIYPCGVCHKEVHDNDQAILCESGCNFWFHRGCTGLTEAAFQLLTAEVYAEWACDKCLASKNIPLVKFKP